MQDKKTSDVSTIVLWPTSMAMTSIGRNVNMFEALFKLKVQNQTYPAFEATPLAPSAPLHAWQRDRLSPKRCTKTHPYSFTLAVQRFEDKQSLCHP